MECDEGGPVQASDGEPSQADCESSAPVRYFDGTVAMSTTDLTSDGFGVPWTQSRSWSNTPGYAGVALTQYGGAPLTYNGNGWVDTQLPFMETNNEYNTAIVVLSGTNALFFDNIGGQWTPRFFTQEQLSLANGEFLLTDTAGDQIHFNAFAGTPGSSQWGRFLSMTDANGNTTTVTSWTADGKPTEIVRSTPLGQSPAATESWLYSYVSSGVNQGLLANVTLRRLAADGTWTIVRQVDYTYYDTGEANGNPNDLKTAIVEDAAGNALDTSYYRYYPDVEGFDGLKYVFNADSFARLSAAVGNPFTATDAQVAPYADNYYEYDAQRRVTKEVAQGTTCDCSDTGGQGTFTYSYDGNDNPTGYNIWQTRTIETLPDNSPTFVSENIVYSNGYGETMLKVYESGPPGQTQQWDTFYEYDNAGRPILKANPSAVTGYDESDPDLLNNVNGHYQYLQDNQGEIDLTDYYTTTTATETTPGGAAGYVQDTKIEQGQLGTPILQTSTQYYAHSGGQVDAQVVTPGGVSASSSATQFNYVAAQTPTVTGLDVTSGSEAGSDQLTILGTGFTGATGIVIGGRAYPDVTPLSDTAVRIGTPSHAPGVVDVQVITPGGISAITPADQFTYVTAPPPVVTGIAPAQGLTTGGSQVTIIGSGFESGDTQVSFGGTPPLSYGSISDDALTVYAPAHAVGIVDVTVTTTAGTSALSPADQFSYVTNLGTEGPVPVVTGLTPTSVYNGDEGLLANVLIIGTGFTNVTGVAFGGTASPSFYAESSNVIQADIPPGLTGTVDVTVTTPGGTSTISPADQFTYLVPPQPTVTAVSPTAGNAAGGNPSLGSDQVVITGTGFTADAQVAFGSISVPTTYLSATTLTATAPAQAAGTVDVTVTTPGGTSAITPADQYTSITPPAPVVTGLGPASGSGAGNQVTIIGSDLAGATQILFGDTPAESFSNISDTAIRATIPSHVLGTVDVTVTTPGGTSGITAADQFTYVVPPAPVVTGVGPTNGSTTGGDYVTIVGTNFTGATAVAFGDKPATYFSLASDNEIYASAPAHAAGVVDITVTTPGGTSTVAAADQFSYVASPPPPGGAPVITGVDPASGSIVGGFPVIIVGSNLSGVTAVSFGDTPVQSFFYANSDNEIDVTDAPAHAAGVVDITVTTPSGTSALSAADQFTYIVPPTPVVTGMSQVSGSVAGSTLVTLIGTGLSGVTEVNFGGTPASIDVFAPSNSDNSLTVTLPPRTLDTVYPVAATTVYRNDDGTGAETTQYAYTWYPGIVRMQSETVTQPVVSADQNGPNVPDTETTVYDIYGRPIWQKDGDGFLTYTAYDPGTGAVIKSITDVDSSRTSEFQDLPAGWTTPPGGGLNLVTTYEVDGLGRTTALTDPNGNVTYTVYDDPDHEVRTYPGWQASTNMPTGPTQVTRTDREHSPSYTETLTMSAPPNVTNGRPDGTEPISDVQTLSRTFTSPGGQVIETDQYFSLDGITYSTDPYLGSAGTNYYATTYGYDHQGRLDRTVSPTGTITRTLYDGLGRVVSTWIGTDDTPASGYWSPDNNTAPSNMVETSAMVYDNGGVGDSNLTQETDFPGGGAAPRVTQNFYDWRDRLVASKQGVEDTENDGTNRPIRYTTYDNLDEAVLVQQYEGDGVSINTVNGVPQPPDPSLLRAQTAYAYDDQGRVYQQLIYDVDPSTGAVSSTALTTNYYYDHRGNQIAESAPGGLWTKEVYDGAGRLAVTYLTDGGGGTSWADAASVANDIVLEQTETVYDGDGNAIENIDRQRFNNATGTGALGDPTSTAAPQARVYYTGSYYDAANRLTATVNVGTNGGTAWIPPATVPVPSDTVLVTSYTYNTAGWMQDTIDPRGLDTRTEYDALGRTTATIANYTGNPETNNSDVATLYTYDGDNNVLTMTAVQPAGTPSQTTEYVYGVSPTDGSAIASNDLLAATLYPDPTTGQPSTNQEESYTHNALGQITSITDRNGTTHQYSYDVLGRQTSDMVTTLGAGVDGSVMRLDTAYDQQGNPYLYTSYADTAGTQVVNQVEDVYNGLDQLIAEYQSHSGPVVIGTTPDVQYTYNEMANGENNSRLTSMIYPDGRVIDYNYTPGLDDRISRLSSISDDTGVLEAYVYLGLNTVVERDHPQTGVDLTYISSTGGTGDAGDQYTGLDRFGRVVEQLWLNTNTGTATDDFQYTYDPDGNVLRENNLVNAAFSEQYGYDNLNRLTSFARSTQAENWSLDALGNWSSVTTDRATQTRTANAQNQYTSLSGGTTPSYDNDGNLTTDPTNGNTYSYDAWNRLVAVESSGTTLASYSYDALGRRITETSTATLDLYFSKDWQVVEEQSGGVMQTQYVWSPVYVDAMVERDTSDGTRLYVQQDANWNVTAVVDVTGTVQERYVYDAYGTATFLAPDWSSRDSSAVAWIYLYQGGRFDSVSGLDAFRNREYSPTLGRWLQQDPLEYIDGMNVYQYEQSQPVNRLDPMGAGTVTWTTTQKWATASEDQLKAWAAKFGRRMGSFEIILGDTDFQIDSVNASCKCHPEMQNKYVVEDLHVYSSIIVYLETGLTGDDLAWAQRAEGDHVTDYNNWAGTKGLEVAKEAFQEAAQNKFPDEASCIQAAVATAMRYLVPWVHQEVIDSMNKHDTPGYHTRGGPHQRP
jgi:RHS repeat-associated protein